MKLRLTFLASNGNQSSNNWVVLNSSLSMVPQLSNLLFKTLNLPPYSSKYLPIWVTWIVFLVYIYQS